MVVQREQSGINPKSICGSKTGVTGNTRRQSDLQPVTPPALTLGNLRQLPIGSRGTNKRDWPGYPPFVLFHCVVRIADLILSIA